MQIASYAIERSLHVRNLQGLRDLEGLYYAQFTAIDTTISIHFHKQSNMFDKPSLLKQQILINFYKVRQYFSTVNMQFCKPNNMFCKITLPFDIVSVSFHQVSVPFAQVSVQFYKVLFTFSKIMNVFGQMPIFVGEKSTSFVLFAMLL